jgi:hypothetical protein
MQTRHFLVGWKKVFTWLVILVFLYPNTLEMILAQDVTGSSLLLDLYCVIVKSFSPFFCETKVMDMQSALRRVGGGQVCQISDRPSGECLKNFTLLQVTILVFL